jgi:signal transduction histidine kinase
LTFFNIFTTKERILPLISIAAVAIMLSIISYIYSITTSNEIAEVSSQHVRSKAIIESHNIAHSLNFKLNDILNNLELIATSPSLQNGEYEKAKQLLKVSQDNTNELTYDYGITDLNGKIFVNNRDYEPLKYQNLKGLLTQLKQYFDVSKVAPTATNNTYYSSIIHEYELDGIPKLYIGYPITNSPNGSDSNNNNNDTRPIKGLVFTSIGLDRLGNLLQNELASEEFQGTISLTDKNGIVLYSDSHSLTNKNAFSEEYQTELFSPEGRNTFNNLLKDALSGNKGSADIAIRGKINTIAYQPVLLNDRYFLSLYILAPHGLDAKISVMINEQKDFNIISLLIIGIVSIGIAILFLSWNNKLQNTVNTRTAELKSANQSLSESNKQLGEVNEQLKVHSTLQKEFVNIAAHELRTPIMPIMGGIELLQDKLGARRNEVKEEISMVTRNAERLLKLSNDVLEVSSIESGNFRLYVKETDLYSLILNVIDDISRKYEVFEKKIPILFDLKQDDHSAKSSSSLTISVQCDPDKINQVLFNLLDNAMRFTEKGKIIVSVCISLIDSQNIIIVRVIDTGKGIDKSIKERLFQKFASKSEKGTGLGLYLSRKIIEAHGGAIWAENNNDGIGSTFGFSLPVIPKDIEQKALYTD